MIPNIEGTCWSVLLSVEEGMLLLLAMELCDAPIFRLYAGLVCRDMLQSVKRLVQCRNPSKDENAIKKIKFHKV